MAPTLGYWNIRGYCEPIRYLLHHAEVEFEDKRYAFDSGKWGEDKYNLGLAFPNLPYYIDGDMKITQTLAILRYLGRKHGLSGTTEEEQVTLDMVEQQAKDLHESLVTVSFFSSEAEFESRKEKFRQDLPVRLPVMESFMTNKKYVLGKRLSYIDFLFYEVLEHLLLFAKDCLDKFSNLREFVEQMRNLPSIQRYTKSDTFKRWPIFSPPAHFGSRGDPPQ